MQETRLIRFGLRALGASGVTRALSPAFRGLGAIFMLHHIRPGGAAKGFAPNAGLEVTPEFLDAAISHVRARGYDIVPLDEAARRIAAGGDGPPFAVFTIDDGYRDNAEIAWPVFRAHDCPFTIFVCTGLIDGTLELWWRVLEEAIAEADEITATLDGEILTLPARDAAEKRAAFATLYWPVRTMGEHAQRRWIADFAEMHGIDMMARCRAAAMSWEEVAAIARDPLCTIGAHTVNHFALARLSRDEAAHEAAQSRDRLADVTGEPPRFFAYPYGDPDSAGAREFALMAELGFEAAVTTRKGVIQARHAHQLTALPRVSLNGLYQDVASLDALISGVPFAALNAAGAAKRALSGFRRGPGPAAASTR